MGLYVSTTGSDVQIPELGIDVVHPVIDQDIGGQFSVEEIQSAGSLTTAIRAGTLIWKKQAGGTAQVPTDYDPDYLLIEQANQGPGKLADRAVTFRDLLTAKSGKLSAFAFTGSPKKATVTFTTPFPSTSYAVVVAGIDTRAWSTEQYQKESFVINSNANLALTGDVQWVAQMVGEQTGG